MHWQRRSQLKRYEGCREMNKRFSLLEILIQHWKKTFLPYSNSTKFSLPSNHPVLNFLYDFRKGANFKECTLSCRWHLRKPWSLHIRMYMWRVAHVLCKNTAAALPFGCVGTAKWPRNLREQSKLFQGLQRTGCSRRVVCLFLLCGS